TEIAQRRVAQRGEHRARRDRLGAETAARCLAVGRERNDRSSRRELRDAQSGDANRGAAPGRDRPREIIRGAACRADDRDRVVSGELLEECGCGPEARGGGCRLDDAERWCWAHVSPAPARRGRESGNGGTTPPCKAILWLFENLVESFREVRKYPRHDRFQPCIGSTRTGS